MSKTMPLTHDVIVRTCGDLLDWQIVAIEKTGGTLEHLEVALAYLALEDDVMGEERRPLTGTPLAIYQILTAEQPPWEVEESGPSSR